MSKQDEPNRDSSKEAAFLQQEMLRLQQRNTELERRLDELQTLLRVLPIGIGIAEDRECRRIRINPEFARMLMLPESANASLTAPEEERPVFRVLFQGVEVAPAELPMQIAAAQGIEVREQELDIVHADGTVLNLLEYAEPLLDAAGQLRGSLGVFIDITERKRVEEERDLLLQRLQLHIERMPIGYLLSGADMRYTDWNPAAEKIFGFSREEALGRHPFELIVPSQSQPKVQTIFEQLRAGDMEAHGIAENVRKNGALILCEWLNTPLMNPDGSFGGLLSMAQDITEKRRMEQQLHQAQKLESIGRLAGGVAHDFNNLLTAILGYTDLAEMEIPQEIPVHSYLHNIRAAGDRAAALTRQLLAFARKQIIEPRELSLNDLILDIGRLLRRLIGEHIEMVVLPAAGLWSVRVDPGQMEQVLINLAVNARDAMQDGGKITIETQNVTLDGGYSRHHPEVEPGDYVLLALSDTGSGIAPEIQGHIFEPFFTTKAVGQGTGLGLATCYGIIKQNGGHIWADSEPGQGASFKIYLPRSTAQPAPLQIREAVRALPRGSETILLVEDEELVRSIAAQSLRGQGYQVLEAANGSEAMRMAGEFAGEIQLLLTDVVMPQMGGKELAQRLQVLRPQIKVLFTSGYTDNAIVHQGRLDPGVEFLPKPFMPSALLLKVRLVLDK